MTVPDPSQENQATTDTSVAATTEATTPTPPVEEAAGAPETASTETPASSETPPATPETPARPDWDKQRQALDQERANFRREIEATKAELEAKLAELRSATAANPPQTTAQKSEVDELLELATAAEQDLYEHGPKALKALTDFIVADKRKQAEEARRKAATEAYWSGFKQANPETPVDAAQKLASECYQYHAAKGLTGEALQAAATARFEALLPSLKKAPPAPSTPAAPTAKVQTAPAARASAPAGVRVTPATNTGARPTPRQRQDVARGIAAMFSNPSRT